MNSQRFMYPAMAALIFLAACAPASTEPDGAVRKQLLEKDGVRIEISWPGTPLAYGQDLEITVLAKIPRGAGFGIPPFDTGRDDLQTGPVDIEQAAGDRGPADPDTVTARIVLIPWRDGGYTFTDLVFVVTDPATGDFINLAAQPIEFTVGAPVLEVSAPGENQAPQWEGLALPPEPRPYKRLALIAATGLVLLFAAAAFVSAFHKRPAKGTIPDKRGILLLQCRQFETHYFLPGPQSGSLKERARHLLGIIGLYLSCTSDPPFDVTAVKNELEELAYGGTPLPDDGRDVLEKRFRDLYRRFRNAALPERGEELP